MFEIELKAWLDNPSEAEQKLASFAEYRGKSFKTDWYWYKEDRKLKIRIREEKFVSSANVEKFSLYVTSKIKTVSDGIEVNNENEFQISDKSAFETFLKAAGFELQSTKNKISKNYYTQNSHIELVEIEGTGHFMEAEILSPSNEPSVVEEIRHTLFGLLEQCGVPASNIEPRFYSELIANKINSKNR